MSWQSRLFSLAVLLLVSFLTACSGGSSSSSTPPPSGGPITNPPAGQAPTVTLTISPTTVLSGQPATLTWATTNATSVSISPDPTPEDSEGIALSGTLTIVPTQTTTFTITATGIAAPNATAQATITVTQATLNFTAAPSTIAPGQSSTLTWTTSNITSLSIDNGVGSNLALPSGSVAVSPGATTTFTATGTTASGATVTRTAVVTVSTAPPPTSNPIKHIIVMVQENRSYDSYFGKLGDYRASKGLPAEAEGPDPNVTLTNHHTGATAKPYHYRTVCTENLSPSWNESHHDVSLAGGDSAWASKTSFSASDFGMKGFMDTTGAVPQQFDPNGTRAMGYYDETDLPYYYELATQFATSDRFFSPLLSNTIPNRMYLFTGTNFGHVRAEPAGHPPFTQKTIFKALNEAGVSWRYYYQDSSVFLAEFADWSEPTIQGKVYNIKDWFNVLASPTADRDLPQVIFIERAGQIGFDEHPLNNVQKGAANTKKIIDALMNSTAWKSSAFILTFDEAGGLYDHVPPVQVPKPDGIAPMLRDTDLKGDFNLTGMRVPFILISPWVKANFVSHKPRDLTGILKFVETQFNVPALTARDAAQPDWSEFFDFSAPQRLAIPPLPDQPTTGVCDQKLEAQP